MPEESAVLRRPDGCGQRGAQKRLSAKLEEVAFRELRDRSEPADRARIVLYAAPGAGRWQEAAPSKTLDMNLSNMEATTQVALMLGVDVYGEEAFCPFCGAVSDRKGVHAMSCTCGGDIDLRHNTIRDVTHVRGL